MSEETQALIDWMAASGVPHTVTATVGRYVSREDPCSPHSATSYHCAEGTGGAGLAVDFAGPDLVAIYRALAPLGPLCAELIFGSTQWKNGRLVAPYDHAENTTNHVHIAVPRGVIVTGGPKVAEPLHALIAICAAPDGDGYWVLAADGAVYAFGSASYAGRLVLDTSGNWEAAR